MPSRTATRRASARSDSAVLGLGRLTPGIQRVTDHLWAFGNEYAALGFHAGTQLCLGQPGVHIQFRHVQISDFDDFIHIIIYSLVLQGE